MCYMLLAQLELNMWEGKCPDIGISFFSDWHASRLPECTILPELKAKWANYANTKCFFRVGSSYSQEDHCKRHSVGLPWTCQATPPAQGHGKHQHISRHAGLTITIHYQYCMILPKTVPKSTASQFLSYNFVKARVCSWGWSFCCRSCCWWWGWSIMMDADASW